MFPDTICYKNPCSNPGFKAKKNLTIKIWEIRLIRNSYSLSSSGSGVRDFIFLIAKIWRNEGALKPTKNITMGKVYMFYDHFNNYWVNLCADARFFLSLKFRKFYLLKIQFLAIFNCHLGALRVFFRKNVRKQTPPKMANSDIFSKNQPFRS